MLRELLTTNKSFIAYKTAADTKKKRVEAIAKFEKEKAADPEKFKNKMPPKVGHSIYESYGLKDFPDQQPVKLPANERAGILTQPAWLVAHSTSFDNHAIHRGKWVRERLLGGVVPDVPITVDAQLPDAPHKTLRERMAVTQQEYCWKCHRLMNDVGYPFEQYDHFGRFRTTETVLDPDATAKNIDKKGKPLGPVMRWADLNTAGLVAFVGDASLEGQIKNPVEFVQKLAGSERVEQVFVRHAFRYWMGPQRIPWRRRKLASHPQGLPREQRQHEGTHHGSGEHALGVPVPGAGEIIGLSVSGTIIRGVLLLPTHHREFFPMSLDRRDALKTLGLSAGATFLAPILGRIEARAAGKAGPAKRFVFVVESNGVRPEQLVPSGVVRDARKTEALNGPEAFHDVTLKDKELPFSLEPVKAWKDKVTIVQGLSGRVCGGGHSNNFGALGCFPTRGESTNILGETIDGALAKANAGIFPHIGLGISKRVENNVIYNISAIGPNKGLPTMCNPANAYGAPLWQRCRRFREAGVRREEQPPRLPEG